MNSNLILRTPTDHPDVWQGVESHRLHAVDIVDDGQTMEAEDTARVVIDILESKAIGTSMSDVETAGNLSMNVDGRTKDAPDTTHVELGERERESERRTTATANGWNSFHCRLPFLLVLQPVVNDIASDGGQDIHTTDSCVEIDRSRGRRLIEVQKRGERRRKRLKEVY